MTSLAAGSLMAVVLLIAAALALWLMRRERGGGGSAGARFRRLRGEGSGGQGGAGEGDGEGREGDGEGDGDGDGGGTPVLKNGHKNGSNGKHVSAGPSETTLAAHNLLDDAEAALAGGDRAGALRMIDDACLLAGEDPMVLRRAEVLRARVA
ncbi:MAG: hypothetical protein IT370_18985 [Deltaproteobacteria bacterium]|nr:hypothetical protein [Deltaproteobacteria bacterium]